jgi:hypothetical protein
MTRKEQLEAEIVELSQAQSTNPRVLSERLKLMNYAETALNEGWYEELGREIARFRRLLTL